MGDYGYSKKKYTSHTYPSLNNDFGISKSFKIKDTYPSNGYTENNCFPYTQSIGITYSIAGYDNGTPLSFNIAFGDGSDDNKPFSAYVYVQTSASAAIGDNINTFLLLDPIANDSVPSDNITSYVFPVKNGWDPNSKVASVNGNSANQNIPINTKEILYTINFQNTGNDTAFNVFILDTLDKNIDLKSIQILNSSRKVNTNILPGGILKFNFNNILLVDSSFNEKASHGFVAYKAQLRPNLAFGTVVKNTAYIYFDFNKAVVTNTTVSTLNLPAGIGQLNSTRISMSIFPNPANNEFTITLNKNSRATA
jgi:uncharacterized repeat protein (TIGR01451 family)